MSNNRFGALFAGRRSKWITLICWIAAIAALTLALPGVQGQKNDHVVNLKESTPSMQAQKLIEEQFPGDDGIPALIVWQREGGLQDTDLSSLQQLAANLASDPLAWQVGFLPLHTMPPPALNAILSGDRSTLVLPVLFDSQADAAELKSSLTELSDRATAVFGTDPFAIELGSSTGLAARVTGPVGIQIDATGLFKNADFMLMLFTLLLVLIILLLIYRSPLLAMLPLVAVGFAYAAISPILGAMAHQGWITVDSQSIAIMTVLLFGAGTDYCLFLIVRFRQLLASEDNASKALLRAFSDSSGAIAMSGLTVVIALLALIFAQYGAYERFAIPFSVSILVMGIASLTLVPALLAILGRSAFYPSIPRTPAMQAAFAQRKGKTRAIRASSSDNNKLGALIVRRPWTIVVVSLVLLGGLAAMSSQIKFTFDIMSSFPKEMASREGFSAIADKFSPGQLAPVKVIVDTKGHSLDLTVQLSGLPYVERATGPETGVKNAQIHAYEVELNLNPYAREAMDHIPDLRLVAENALRAAGVDQEANHVWIGGQTAVQYDTLIVGNRDARVVIPIVITMIALLLLIYLRSVVAMFYLIGTVILSYFSALGLGWLILHYVFGAEAISGSIPLYAFVFLVALGEDYNIFMISSIWKKRTNRPLRQAIQAVVGDTGSVITSAGLILAGTFAVLATLPIQVLVQFGLITAVGVLLDTFIVRPFLVPAITALFGRWAFWPGKHQEVQERIEVSS